jgi:CrcB protein
MALHHDHTSATSGSMQSEMARQRWTADRVVAVAVGGVAGATVRWLVQSGWEAGDFPWPVLALNIAGSFALGVVLAEEWTHPRARLVLHDLAGIGFCGSLTTFGTFAVDAAKLLEDDRTGLGIAYLIASPTGTVLAVFAGAAMLRRVRALTLPLEERP